MPRSPTAYERRNQRAQAAGWANYPQQRRYQHRLGTDAFIRRLAAECCGGHKEHARDGSIMCGHCNARVNPYNAKRIGSWKVRLVRATLDTRRRRRAARRGWQTRRRNA